ncbi:MAG: hypothetical protein LBG79_02360 [Spirochaetaceae bacterium]|nr:hypothetical protein [Spirochaetaceae bacterium]
MFLLTSIAVASFILAVLLLFLLKYFAPSVFSKNHAKSSGNMCAEHGESKESASKKKKKSGNSGNFEVNEGKRGDPHTCPVCAAKFEHGESVRSKIFPPTERNDRLLHISGCFYCCYEGGRKRECPVCGAELSLSDYLTARIFVKRDKSHVHIVGCPHCRSGRHSAN